MIIIRYNEWIRLLPEEKHIVYEICDEKFKRLRIIDRTEAKRLINIHGLKLVFKSKDGAIFR